METKRYNAYNSTRGTVLNAKLAVADRQLEPLKFLELLIGGLGLDSESGLWLKPLACAPQVPRVFPFDMVYLDHNQKVIQAAEVFPSGDFPTFSEEVVSALILPLHAASSTQTRPGDQLLVRAEDQLSEQPQETPHQAPEVPPQVQEAVVQLPGPSQQASEVSLQIQEVVLQSAESSQQAAEAPLQIHEADPQLPELPRQPPESSPTIQEASPQTSPAAASSSKFLYEPSRQSWELPLEGFWAPQSPAPESVTEAGKSATEPGDRAKPAVVTSTIPIPATPLAAKSLGTVERETGYARGTTASTPGSMQSVGFTFAQYRSWQPSTSTAPAPAWKGKKPPSQEPTAEGTSDPTQSASKEDTKKKQAEKSLHTPPSAEPAFEPPAQREGPSSRETSDLQKTGSTPRAAVPRKELLLDAAKASQRSSPARISPIAETGKLTNQKPPNGNGSRSSAPDPGAKHEPPLPLWKASPSPAPPASTPPKTPALLNGHAETTEQSRRGHSAPQLESQNRVERPAAPIERIAKRSETKLVVDQLSHSASLPRMSEALARLMAALHRMSANPEPQLGARRKGSEANTPSSWLNPEALHRDRRRAVRRAVPGMVAFYFTGGAPQPYTIADISATGFFLLTRDQWMPETMIQMTLQKPVSEGKQRKEALTVLTRIVRRGEDGIGAEFVMPESLDSNNHEIKPGRATDRMALARFLFSEEFLDSFEVLGCSITPPVEQQTGI